MSLRRRLAQKLMEWLCEGHRWERVRLLEKRMWYCHRCGTLKARENG